MSAVVLATHIWPSTSELPIPVEFLDLEFTGAIGDRHYGSTMTAGVREKKLFTKGTEIANLRQISIVDRGELDRVAATLGIEAIDPGVIADNIYTEGIDDLTSLPPMTRLEFSSGAILLLGGENFPCTIAGAMVHQAHGARTESFPKAAMGLRGVTAWVERPAPIRPGDHITVHRWA
jgi:MOSC domain-containing protein YiiM